MVFTLNDEGDISGMKMAEHLNIQPADLALNQVAVLAEFPREVGEGKAKAKFIVRPGNEGAITDETRESFKKTISAFTGDDWDVTEQHEGA